MVAGLGRKTYMIERRIDANDISGMSVGDKISITFKVSFDGSYANPRLIIKKASCNNSGCAQVISLTNNTCNNQYATYTKEFTVTDDNMVIAFVADFTDKDSYSPNTGGGCDPNWTNAIYLKDWKLTLKDQVINTNTALVATTRVLKPEYRFGFQGQERDDEVKGIGNSYSYLFRMHDPRLGRFLSVDPLTKIYLMYSPYHFSSNQPIHASEWEGAESRYDLTSQDPGLRNWFATTAKSPQEKEALTKIYNDAAHKPAAVGVGVGLVAALVAADVYFTGGATTTMVLASMLATQTAQTYSAIDPEATGNGNGGPIIVPIIPTPFMWSPAVAAVASEMSTNAQATTSLTVTEFDGFITASDELGNSVGRAWLSGEGQISMGINTSNSSATGRQTFNELFTFMDQNYEGVTSLRATWVSGPMGDNLATFNRLVASGEYSLEEAAFQTFTGKVASERGFNTARMITGEKAADGTYNTVEFIFE